MSFWVVFIILVVSYFLGNAYVFIRGLQAVAAFPGGLKVFLGAAFWICSLSLFLVFVMNRFNIPFQMGRAIYRVGTGWLVFTLYMVIFLALSDLVKVFNHSFNGGFLSALLLTTILLAVGYYRYQHPSKQIVNIDVNKPLGEGGRQIKVVGISDVHLGYGTDKAQLRRFVKMVNDERPDLILIAGDLIDSRMEPVIGQRMEEELAQLSASMGVYIVPGNHDYMSGIDGVADLIRRVGGIQLMRDTVVLLPCGLQIVGRDDFSNRNRLSKDDLMHLVDKSRPVVVLDHQPRKLGEAEELGADLQFSGHTHDGQIFPLNLVTDRLFEVGYGYKKLGDTHIYVSSGLSLWGPPFRIGTRSELVIFNMNFVQ